jgi:dihydropteroate synthase
MQLFGILNITPDSFSDGGLFVEEQNAIKQAEYLARNCHAIDIGAQSTRYNANVITAIDEQKRLGNIINNISKFATVSVDTFNIETQKLAIDQGAAYINDVCAFPNTEIFKYAPKHIKFIFMHHLVVPPTKVHIMQTQKMDMVNEIKSWALKKIEDYSTFGITKDRLIFDVGIGFGKDAHQSLYIINHIEEFLSLNVQIMLGHSRKSFMEVIKPNANIQEKDIITQEITDEVAKKGIHYARVHKV